MQPITFHTVIAATFFGIGILAAPHASRAQGADIQALYTKCAFYPQAEVCDQAYKIALADKDNPAAAAVKAEYEGYGHYLKSNGTALTPQDEVYLRAHAIRLPDHLSEAQRSGLHNVIQDPALQQDLSAKNSAITNFIGRAVQANLYCVFNDCGATGGAETRVRSQPSHEDFPS
jgi:hypothetical protein